MTTDRSQLQCIMCSTDQWCCRVESDAHFDALHESGETPFLREAAQEAPVLKDLQHLEGDAAAYEHAAGCHTLEREVPRFGAIQCGKQLQRGDTERVFAGQAHLRDDGVWVPSP